VNKWDLVSRYASKHRPRGGVDREALEALVEAGMSVRRIAAELDLSPTSVRHWLHKFDLSTRPPVAGIDLPEIVRECAHHGWTAWVRSGAGDRYRCKRCRIAAVSGRRRKVKQILVAEAGGACRLCGYARYAGALQFHHVDPTAKTFALSSRGLARSLAKARAEVAKCVLLCANCHAEVEGGVATIAAATSPPIA
jgi:AcrR family transcriptional regulator